ncbi:hypothetical protein EVAR_64963_1 [Eumeta japonica]|uniref:Uncharacterized protein n=1 Tax=Eumeta variegata TaxID=151549 RepID=A0A4C1ZNQ0_EUMVA|nr:hypothetical protein EVAR_64963_1 [Eumeta japonica]
MSDRGITTVVLECTPSCVTSYRPGESVRGLGGGRNLRTSLGVTCCRKCQQYGHPEKFCRSKEVCSGCGLTGHRKASRRKRHAVPRAIGLVSAMLPHI